MKRDSFATSKGADSFAKAGSCISVLVFKVFNLAIVLTFIHKRKEPNVPQATKGSTKKTVSLVLVVNQVDFHWLDIVLVLVAVNVVQKKLASNL